MAQSLGPCAAARHFTSAPSFCSLGPVRATLPNFALHFQRRSSQVRIVRIGIRPCARTSHVAARAREAHRQDPEPSAGLAARCSHSCLLSIVRRIIPLEGGVYCARSRDELRRHGSSEWARRWAGWAWESLAQGVEDGVECDRVRSPCSIMCTRDAGAGQTGSTTSGDINPDLFDF
jgi:hypothetical protein